VAGRPVQRLTRLHYKDCGNSGITTSQFVGLNQPLTFARIAKKVVYCSYTQRLVKTGGRLVKHARYYWLLLAEEHLTRRLFGSMLRMIAALPLPNQ